MADATTGNADNASSVTVPSTSAAADEATVTAAASDAGTETTATADAAAVDDSDVAINGAVESVPDAEATATVDAATVANNIVVTNGSAESVRDSENTATVDAMAVDDSTVAINGSAKSVDGASEQTAAAPPAPVVGDSAEEQVSTTLENNNEALKHEQETVSESAEAPDAIPPIISPSSSEEASGASAEANVSGKRKEVDASDNTVQSEEASASKRQKTAESDVIKTEEPTVAPPPLDTSAPAAAAKESKEAPLIGDATPTMLSRDDMAKMEEDGGLVTFDVITNDGTPEHLIQLTTLKNIFARQLPKMPKEYIVRLVFDRNHRSMVILKNGTHVIGGICYRPFLPNHFAEIAFCAINAADQVKGYGTRLMNHLKEFVKHDGITHFLTYADNYAIGYFKKQGFAKVVSMPRPNWFGYIKDYDGGTLMECTIHYQIDYLRITSMVHRQRKVRLCA